MAFRPSVIFQPQFVATGAAAALAMVTSLSGTTGAAVPNLTQIYLGSVRFVNVTAVAHTLKVWRVPSGSTAIDINVAIDTITIPVASENYPYFEWNPGAYLSPGDAIFAVADTASVISVSGDGALINQ